MIGRGLRLQMMLAGTLVTIVFSVIIGAATYRSMKRLLEERFLVQRAE